MDNHKIDVLPSLEDMLRGPLRQDDLVRIVQQKVAEIMAERDALVFEPFFRSRQVAYELKRLQTVPEQEKFTVAYERYGCMICERHSRPHAGNGLCAACRSKWFRRFAEIIAEGMAGTPARAAKGASRAERLLPENATGDVRHTWLQPYNRRSESEKLLHARVAKRLRVSISWVSDVARGHGKSAIVSAVLSEERDRLEREVSK